MHYKFQQADNLSTDDRKGVIVGEGLARNLGANVGDQVILLASTASGGINAVEVTIRGLFSTVTKSYDDSALRMPIDTARQLLRTQGSHIWTVLLHDTAQTDAVLEKLRSRLPHGQFEIVPWYRLADFYNKTVTLYNKQIEVIQLIIALIILLSISNTMTMSVMERIGEIGTARSTRHQTGRYHPHVPQRRDCSGLFWRFNRFNDRDFIGQRSFDYWHSHAAATGYGARLYRRNSRHLAYSPGIPVTRDKHNFTG